MAWTQQDEAEATKKAAETRKWMEEHTPICCPKCGSKDLHYHIATWFAHSLDELDLHNTAEIVEHQCEECGLAFWF